MDRQTQMRHLAQAERHVSLGARLIAEQERRIAMLSLGVMEARRLLEAFLETQAQHIAHRDLILRELNE